MQKNIAKNIIKHIKLVSKHKWLVFKFSCRLGIPFRGFMHDWSKFSWEEFFESVKYYNGSKSPIVECRRDKGYSKAWLHHKGRNKHHDVYWVDLTAPEVAPVIPYKYVVEMLCDKLSASIIYNGKNWTQRSQYDYWQKEKNKTIIHPKIENFLTQVFTQVKDYGIDKTITKQNIKNLYKKCCLDDKTKYKYEFHGEWKKID